MFAALTLIVIGALILATWCGVLSLVSSASIVLCFIGAFIIASKRDFLGWFWGGVVVATGIAVFVASRVGVSPGIATLLIGVGLAYVLANAVKPSR